MDKLLGHLAQFGSFIKQGELLCTQGLTYLLRNSEGERVFAEWISSISGQPVSHGLSWHAESRQEDGGRPDLEGRDDGGKPVVKIEAKLGAPFGTGQLESYLAALCARGEGGTLLMVVPKSRLEEITGAALEHLRIEGPAPWRIRRGDVEVPCTVATWEDLLDALAVVESSGFRDDLGQFRAMYRVFNGDDMEPLTSDEQVLAWRDQEQWWEMLVEQTTRALTPRGSVLPLGLEGGPQPYRRRYVPGPASAVDSFYSIGTRDPFQQHRTPIWFRFHKRTGQFGRIAGRLERSELQGNVVRSEGHVWLPLEVPLNCDRNAMVGALVAQVERILDAAYSTLAE
jgi:hypothetical protein